MMPFGLLKVIVGIAIIALALWLWNKGGWWAWAGVFVGVGGLENVVEGIYRMFVSD